MNADTIKALARYFTGPDIAAHSIGLQIPSKKDAARRFFDTRTALGIRGYDTEDEAVRAIERTLSR